jgi:hypothetical protein
MKYPDNFDENLYKIITLLGFEILPFLSGTIRAEIRDKKIDYIFPVHSKLILLCFVINKFVWGLPSAM